LIKDFQRLILDRYAGHSEQSPVLSDLLLRLQNKPFWIWDKEEHKQAYNQNKDCCFNHIVSLPKKLGGPPQSLYPFQKQIYDTLFLKENNFKDYHLWLKKSTGIGATTLFTRILTWFCVKDSKLANSDVIVIVGPRLELATMIINKIKSVFTVADPRIKFNSKETAVFLNSADNDEPARIVAYPSNHTSTARGLVPSIILMDECAYFSKSEASEARILGVAVLLPPLLLPPLLPLPLLLLEPSEALTFNADKRKTCVIRGSLSTKEASLNDTVHRKT
jgi:hypothetical protein